MASGSSSTGSDYPRIAIIGGGLGGLALLLTLHRRGVPATLYERDASPTARAHLGGQLDLGWKSGQRALRENGLHDAFVQHSRPEGEELRMYDAIGTILMHHGTEDAEGGPGPTSPEDVRPEIDRTVLRGLLLAAIPPALIKWDYALSSVRTLGDGQHELTFANGAVVPACDLLVGADGTSSRVRPLLSPATPTFTGITGVETSLAPETATLPELADAVAAVGRGTMFALRDEKMLGSQPTGDGRIRTYAWFRAPAPDWAPAVAADPAATKRALLDMYAGWAPWMRQLIEHCDEGAIYPRPLFALPTGHRWAHVPGVTLLGDAAHLMSPFAGAGANLALLDGLELGIALAELQAQEKLGSAPDVDAAVAAFEEKMCEMAGRVAEKAAGTAEAFINPDAPASALARFKALGSEGEREG